MILLYQMIQWLHNQKKEEAIKLAINKALSDVFSKIAIHSL